MGSEETEVTTRCAKCHKWNKNTEFQKLCNGCKDGVVECLVCKTPFDDLGNAVVCSIACNNQYIYETFDSCLACGKTGDTICPGCEDLPFVIILDSLLASRSFLVKKGWGGEIHITNNNDYCLKYLVFTEGKRFSYHYHKLKRELWHCIIGGFDMRLDGEDGMLLGGGKIEIPQNQIHQLVANSPSIIVEVSTTDFPEDSYRIAKGD